MPPLPDDLWITLRDAVAWLNKPTAQADIFSAARAGKIKLERRTQSGRFKTIDPRRLRAVEASVEQAQAKSDEPAKLGDDLQLFAGGVTNIDIVYDDGTGRSPDALHVSGVTDADIFIGRDDLIKLGGPRKGARKETIDERGARWLSEMNGKPNLADAKQIWLHERKRWDVETILRYARAVKRRSRPG